MIRKFTVLQKKAILFVSAIIGTLENKDTWIDFNVGHEMQKQIYKVTEETRKLANYFHINQAEADELTKIAEMKEYIVEVFTNTELNLQLRKYRSQTITMKREDVFNLIEYAMMPCQNCTSNVKKCQLRNVLKKLEIEALDPEKMYKCEYCMNRKVAQ